MTLDESRWAVLGTSAALVDQLTLPTKHSPEHCHDVVFQRTGAPATKSQAIDTTRHTDDAKHEQQANTSCHPHSYLLTMEECPHYKDHGDLLQQSWRDEASHAGTSRDAHAGARTDHYDVCNTRVSQGGVATHPLRAQS